MLTFGGHVIRAALSVCSKCSHRYPLPVTKSSMKAVLFLKHMTENQAMQSSMIERKQEGDL